MQYLENDHLKIAVSLHGAELCSIYDKEKDREILWQADPAYWNRHSPILFPFVGNVNNGVYRYKGQTYPMSSHGFARDMEFTLKEETSDRLSFVLRSNDMTLQNYPFHFELTVTYVLKDRSISVIWDVKNPSESEPLYYSIGGHPAFNCPLEKNKTRNDYLVKFNRSDLKYVLIIPKIREVDYKSPNSLNLTDGYLNITDELFLKDALIFDDYQIESASLCTPDKKPYVTLSCKGFPSFGLWSKPSVDASYVCLEPWIGRCDNKGFDGELPEKYCIQLAHPGSVNTHSYEITIH